MIEAIHKMNDGETQYEVYYDPFGYEDTFGKDGWDFESEEDKEAYRERFLNDEISAFGVAQFYLCKCCDSWAQKASLWGIHAESPEEALKQYIQDHKE